MNSRPSVILLVEDDPDFSEVCALVLRSGGYEVLSAPDHRLALDILESDQPVDLLLTDLTMPGRANGMALARMARLRRPRLGILYLTGQSADDVASEALGPILQKPVANERLLAEVASAISDPWFVRSASAG